MNREQEFKLQSYVDGELPRRESEGVRDWISQSPEAQRLLRELQWSRAAISENEPRIAVPESREFYWNTIERAIHRDAAARGRNPRPLSFPWLADLMRGARRLLAPSAGLALVMILVVGVIKFYEIAAPEDYPRHLAQIENPSEDMGSFSFRSQADNVFVVWLYDRSPHAGLSRDLQNTMVIQ
jgi:anti-sigma factor RsiW